MKKLIVLAFALVSSSAFAQLNLDFRSVGSSFQLGFSKGVVCKVNPAFSTAPTLGYGQTALEARSNAINNCIAETGNHRMHCDDLVCENISFGGGKPTISISVEQGQIGVRFSIGAKHTCVAEAAFGHGNFIAKAPTKIEAEVYAQKLCMEQTGNARMHCDVEECVSIRTGGSIFGRFGLRN